MDFQIVWIQSNDTVAPVLYDMHRHICSSTAVCTSHLFRFVTKCLQHSTLLKVCSFSKIHSVSKHVLNLCRNYQKDTTFFQKEHFFRTSSSFSMYPLSKTNMFWRNCITSLVSQTHSSSAQYMNLPFVDPWTNLRISSQWNQSRYFFTRYVRKFTLKRNYIRTHLSHQCAL